MWREPVGVGPRADQARIRALGDQVERFIGGDHVAAPVHDERGVGQVALEDVANRGAHRGQGRVIEGTLRIDGGVPGRQQQLVALPQRKLERLGQPDDHVPAGSGPAGLDEAEMPLGGAGSQGEIELAQMTAGAAVTQLVGEVHVPVVTRPGRSRPFPRGNCA